MLAGGVDLIGGNINIGKNAGVVAGINADKMQAFNSQTQAEQLFNSLVKTENVNIGSEFASDEFGQIYIKSSQGVNVQGNLVNYATGSNGTSVNSQSGIRITNIDSGVNGTTISGNIANAKGTVNISNNNGNLTVTDTGYIKNDGYTLITNNPYRDYVDDTNTRLTLQILHMTVMRLYLTDMKVMKPLQVLMKQEL